jgi:serine/threonine protein kinase
VDAAADVWGLGVVLFEAATGEGAFDDDRDDDHEYPQLHRRADPVRSVRPRLPDPLARTIDRCLEPDPAARPALAQLVAACDAVTR